MMSYKVPAVSDLPRVLIALIILALVVLVASKALTWSASKASSALS